MTPNEVLLLIVARFKDRNFN